MILVLRSIDRVGKGVRSAPRDALVADATPPGMHGYAFGYHRAMDNGGAVAGSLVAAAALAWSGLSLTEVILWSAVPGFVAVLLLGVGVKEERERSPVACSGSSSCCAAAFALVSIIPAHAALSSGTDAVHIRPRLGNFYPAAGAPIGRGRSRIIVAVVDPESLQSGHLHLGWATGR